MRKKLRKLICKSSFLPLSIHTLNVRFRRKTILEVPRFDFLADFVGEEGGEEEKEEEEGKPKRRRKKTEKTVKDEDEEDE